MKRLIILTLLIFVAACTSQNQGDIRFAEDQFKTGTQGLELTFDRSFPEEVFEGESFIIVFDVENKGAYETEGIIVVGTEQGFVQLSRESNDWIAAPSQLQPDPTQNVVNLNQFPGKSQFSPNGEKGTVTITATAAELDEREVVHRTQINLNACYKYAASTTKSVCIDTDPLNRARAEKTCTVQDIILDSQGGPVAITKIEPRMASRPNNMVQPEFTITIKNKGSGLIVNPEKFAGACGTGNQDFDSTDFNRITMKASIPSLGEAGELECEPQPLRLTTSQDYVRCRLKEPISDSSNSYTTALNIEMEYGYQFSETKQFDIRGAR